MLEARQNILIRTSNPSIEPRQTNFVTSLDTDKRASKPMNNNACMPEFSNSRPYPPDVGTTAAFFDVDGTLLPGTYGERIFIRYLLDYNVLTFKHLARYLISVIVRDNPFRRQSWEQNKMYLKNLPTAQLREYARKCYCERISPRLSGKGLSTVAEHLRKGHRVFLVSASLRWLVESLGEQIGAHGLLATRLAAEDASLTGHTLGGFLYGQSKAALLRRWISWWNIDPNSSFAYSDHHSDIPMLEMVGHPVAVNPSRRMRRHALERGWRVETF
jgi:HAD superfamily hydrolase (TIGR01490 family)